MTENYHSDELLNCAIFHPRKEDQNGVNGRFGWPVQRRSLGLKWFAALDWNAPATVEQAIEVLEGFHPKWRAIVS